MRDNLYSYQSQRGRIQDVLSSIDSYVFPKDKWTYLVFLNVVLNLMQMYQN